MRRTLQEYRHLILLFAVVVAFSGAVMDTVSAASRYDWEGLCQTIDDSSQKGRFFQGIAYANLGRLAEAFRYFEEIAKTEAPVLKELMEEHKALVEQDPSDLLSLNVLAFAAYAVDEQDLSVMYFRQVIDQDTENVWPRNFLAVVYGDQGKVPDAMAQLREALEIEPDNQYTHLLMAAGYKEQKQLVAAIYHYLRAPDAVKALRQHGVE